MVIYKKKLNQGENFICSISAAKKMFNKTNIHISFGMFGRQYCISPKDKNYYFYKKKVNAFVVSSLQITNGVDSSLLNFYVMNASEFCKEMQEEFENVFLKKIYDFYVDAIKKKYKETSEIFVIIKNNQLQVISGILEK